MFEALERLADLIRSTRIIRPGLVALAGVIGITVARDNVDNAPLVLCVVLAAAMVATFFRERGAAVAAIGVAATAAFATPAGLGPLLVATGVVLAAHPATVDRRLAAWPEIVDGLLAVPGFAGLASVAAAQPSQRGAVLAAASLVFLVGTWWRGPRHADTYGHRDSVASYLGALGGVALLLGAEQFDFLGDLPSAVTTAGRGLAAGLAVFGVACLVQAVREDRALLPPDGRARHVVR